MSRTFLPKLRSVKNGVNDGRSLRLKYARAGSIVDVQLMDRLNGLGEDNLAAVEWRELTSSSSDAYDRIAGRAGSDRSDGGIRGRV